ncbi:Uncharacterized protein HZ326_26208 [Fusarium oxysporum f. sp. albedinis]|nr:Uncharacterized protein HZ326_26208 [Fusarium oxysporum f. sp. albedinis]
MHTIKSVIIGLLIERAHTALATPPESIPTVSSPESIPTVSSPESVPTVSSPQFTRPESAAFQTLIKQSPNEPTQTTEGRTRDPNSLHVPTKAVSVPTGKTDKTQPGTTDFRTVTSPSSSPTGKSLELDLSDAQFGEHARFIQIDGEAAMQVHSIATLHLL